VIKRKRPEAAEEINLEAQEKALDEVGIEMLMEMGLSRERAIELQRAPAARPHPPVSMQPKARRGPKGGE
jgi:hypothetical protein